ncbi:methyltransferase-like protein 7A [Acanthaster planci]|uniref:Methyltransferase-like protein 7A n=1 Tax=Acanthaster planci TaxID=133434 RepID=A0A8B7XX48_ACAPL|nr:methyltransferase-like protein 7A [Acanthaster planci]
MPVNLTKIMEKLTFTSVLDYVVPVTLFLGVLLILHVLKQMLLPHIYPMFLNSFMRKYNEAMGSFKAELLKEMKDQVESLREKPVDGGEGSVNGESHPSLTVLEIGVGAGANFKYYPDGTSVIAVEPNKNFASYLEQNVAEHFPRVRLERTVVAFGEDLRGHVDDCSVDAVVITLVLCSVQDVDAVIREVKRVLKPDGKFYFLEHVAADPQTWTSTLQWVIQPIWSYFGDGCQLTRKISAEVDRAGFCKVHHQRFRAHPKFPRVLRPHLMGVATKSVSSASQSC